MLSLETVLSRIESGEMQSQCIGKQDFTSLSLFIPIEHLHLIDMHADAWHHQPWSEDNIVKMLGKIYLHAVTYRKLSSLWVEEVVKMWMAILEDEDFGDGTGFESSELSYTAQVWEKYRRKFKCLEKKY